jgi:hypothetical protein
MSDEGKRDQYFNAAKEPIRYNLRCRWAVLGNPIKDVLDISNRSIVEYKLHTLLRTQPSNSLPRLGMG